MHSFPPSNVIPGMVTEDKALLSPSLSVLTCLPACLVCAAESRSRPCTLITLSGWGCVTVYTVVLVAEGEALAGMLKCVLEFVTSALIMLLYAS